MYTGHAGIALGAHGIRRSIPLWLLIFASQLPDWTDAGLCFAGIKPAVPGMYSHSFPATFVLAIAAALLYCAIERDPAGMFVVALVTVSHVAADYVTGIKPTWPGGPMIGLELYHRPFIDLVIEVAVVVTGWMIYRRSLPREKRSTEPVLTLLSVLIVIQIGADVLLLFAKGLKKC